MILISKKPNRRMIISLFILFIMVFNLTGICNSENIGSVEEASTKIDNIDNSNINKSADLEINSNQWFYSDILFADQKGWLDSFDRNTFSPDTDITVSQFIKLCLAFTGERIAESDDPNDMSFLGKAQEKGIIYKNNNFSYENILSRRDAAKIICNLLMLEPSTNKSIYSDTNDPFAQKLYDEYILRTYPSKNKYYYKPGKTLTIAEAIALLVTAYKYENMYEEFEACKNEKVDKNIKLPVLEYHSLSNKSDNWGDYEIAPKKFSDDMKLVKSLGYTTVGISEMTAFVNGYLRNLPKKPIIITFDDGYSDNYYYAFQIAKKLNIKIEVFIVGSRVNFISYKGEQNFLQVDQLVEMYNSGLVGFQNHTYSMHSMDDRNGLPGNLAKGKNETYDGYTQRIMTDFDLNRTFIQDYLGCKVESVSFPYGIYNSLCEKDLEKDGYEMTLTSNKGVNNLADGLFMLKRISMQDKLDRNKLKSLIS